MAAAAPVTSASPASLWRPSPRRLLQLLVGLWAFGAGEAFIVCAGLGNSPWTVLAEGVGEQTPLSIGAATVALSFVVLAAWIPLRRRPGLGTVLNAVLVGVALGVVVSVLPDDPGDVARAALLLGGIALIGIGSAFYIGAGLGAGPRDSLMLVGSTRTGVRVGVVTGVIEISVLVVGWMLGGAVGIGTLAFALLVGPSVEASFGLLRRSPLVCPAATAPSASLPHPRIRDRRSNGPRSTAADSGAGIGEPAAPLARRQ